MMPVEEENNKIKFIFKMHSLFFFLFLSFLSSFSQTHTSPLLYRPENITEHLTLRRIYGVEKVADFQIPFQKNSELCRNIQHIFSHTARHDRLPFATYSTCISLVYT